MTHRSEYLHDRRVDGSGPLTAPMLWVGEAPGREEVVRGVPFVGASGSWVRDELARCGLNVATDVRFENVVPVNPGKLTPQRHTALLDEHWTNIDAALTGMPNLRVVVACGGLALRRLTGLTDITDEHGGVIPVRDLPATSIVRGRVRAFGVPATATIVPVLHPAGIMRTKLQADRTTWRVGVRRAVEVARGKMFDDGVPGCVVNPSAAELDHRLHNATAVSIDTEFDRVTKVPYLIGLYVGHSPVYILRAPVDRWHDVLWRHLVHGYPRTPDLLKISHNNTAEWSSLATIGLDVRAGRWYDTMLAYAALYPDVRKGLSHAALHYVDGARNWKDLPSTDPAYLTRDVYYQWRVWEATRDELASAGMLPLWMDEVTAVAPVLYDLEMDGLRVDGEAQSAMLAANERQRAVLANTIERAVHAYFGVRVASAVEIADAATSTLQSHIDTPPSPVLRCLVHPTYDGSRAKRWAVAVDCWCRLVHADPAAIAWRSQRDAVRSVKGKATTAADRLARGFQARNNGDLRWLLYDRGALALPVQLGDEGRPTADADAVQRLIVGMLDAVDKPRSKYHRTDAPAVIALLTAVKEFQHLEKVASTFLCPPVDSAGVAHPPYRGWGAGTGRPASGADDDADDASSEYAFNVLNVPKGCRRIFVPSTPGNVFVAADWSQMESWATAYFADDDVMMGELTAQLTGGPKVHAVNAALIYDIPLDRAGKGGEKVKLKGRTVDAYEGGKRISHLVNYGGEGGMIAKTLWVGRAAADAAVAKLHAKYARTTAHRGELADEVFGCALWSCTRCGLHGTSEMACPMCSRPKVPVMMARVGWAAPPTRVHYTPFRRRRWYLGRRRDGANALASQDPQSACASVAYRTLCRLRGFEVVDGERRSWPVPSFAYTLRTFTYDANVIECAAVDANDCLRWLLWTMEQPWAVLGGLRFPAEGSIGRNWMDANDDNPDGLREIPVSPLTSVWQPITRGYAPHARIE